ncbi:hypothetical protein A2U01_0114608, partial [Trifolium medium]|nr:hypothetical protein [Trifolium medium]
NGLAGKGNKGSRRKGAKPTSVTHGGVATPNESIAPPRAQSTSRRWLVRSETGEERLV